MSLQTRLASLISAIGADIKSLQQSITNTKLYVQSRGTNLVTNGTGLLGDNTNFSFATFDRTDAPVGVSGAFDTIPGGGTVMADEFIPVDPGKKLKFSFYLKQKGTSTDGRWYAMVIPYDAYKLSIAPQHYMYQLGTTTELAVDLNPGDTTITLVSSANWYGSAAKPAGGNTHYRSIIWWDYTDQGGKLWPPESYSRNVFGFDKWADGGIDGNVITLRAPYDGPAKPAGTKLSNGSSGGTYMYTKGGNSVIPATWTEIMDTIVGLHAVPNMSAGFSSGWPQGTAYAKIGWLKNRTPGSPYSDLNSKMSIAGVSFGDAQAAQDDAASALSGLSTKSDLGHNHDDRYFTETEVTNLLAGKASSTHDHDGRYYTETEVNNLLANKADASHTHDEFMSGATALYVWRVGEPTPSLPLPAGSKWEIQIGPTTEIPNWVPVGTKIVRSAAWGS